MSERGTLRKAFLESRDIDPGAAEPLSADASFRRYFRIKGEPSHVLMDAPPDKEDTIPFIAVAEYLRGRGFSAPRIEAYDVKNGFLLLEDLGDDRFTRLLKNGAETECERTLYEAAVDALVSLHGDAPPESLAIALHGHYALPRYDNAELLREAFLFTDWYLPAVTGHATDNAARAGFEDAWRAVFPVCHLGPRVLVERDYHADNLMWMAEREGIARVGMLDFQDAVIGDAAYDVVSLLQDARRDIGPALEEAMIARYLESIPASRPDIDPAVFKRSYAVLGAQRNTKIIGIFTRLCHRDGKADYLELIPRVWKRLERNLEDPALAPVREWFAARCPEDIRTKPEPEAPADE